MGAERGDWTIPEAFAVIPTFPCAAEWRQGVGGQRCLQAAGFGIHIQTEPVIGNARDGDEVDRPGDIPLCGDAEAVVPAHGLNLHLFYAKSLCFQQHPVIIQLHGPFKDGFHPIGSPLFTKSGLSFFESAPIDFSGGDIDLVISERLHQLVGRCNFIVPQYEGMVIKDFSVQVKLAAGDAVEEPLFTEDFAVGVFLLEGMYGCAVKGENLLHGIDCVGGRAPEIRFSRASQKLRYAGAKKFPVDGSGNSAERGKKHATVGLAAMPQAMGDRDTSPVWANKLCRWHEDSFLPVDVAKHIVDFDRRKKKEAALGAAPSFSYGFNIQRSMKSALFFFFCVSNRKMCDRFQDIKPHGSSPPSRLRVLCKMPRYCASRKGMTARGMMIFVPLSVTVGSVDKMLPPIRSRYVARS